MACMLTTLVPSGKWKLFDRELSLAATDLLL